MEVDYRGLHPSLLYQRAGLAEPTEDAYTIDGYPRKLVKKAFNILINRKKPAPATKSLIFYLNKNKKEYVEDKYPIPPTIDTEYCIALEQAIRNHHKSIEHFFCTGVGLELQNHDSLLCSHIFDYFIHKTETVVIAVHDSFIVKQSEMKHLAEAIRYAETVVAKSLNRPYREPLLEAERIKEIESYQEDLVKYFGSISKSSTTEEQSIIGNLIPELELLEDIESLADEDADYANELQ
jgi:predicted subunit of tRNA(5-methylaminomethyl-2-thiouridylate) methyltransferase